MLEYEGIWRAMLFREHVLSDALPHLHNKNDNAHKLFFTSSQNWTFSLNQSLFELKFINSIPRKIVVASLEKKYIFINYGGFPLKSLGALTN